MTVWRVSCIFQSCASSPNNAKSREAQVPVKQECGLWWKDSSPWEDWLVTWQVCRITTIKKNIYYNIIKYNNIVFCKKIPHAISIWNMIPGSLSHVFKYVQEHLAVSRTPSLSQAIQRCAQHPDNSVYDCRWHEILPRSSIQRLMF